MRDLGGIKEVEKNQDQKFWAGLALLCFAVVLAVIAALKVTMFVWLSFHNRFKDFAILTLINAALFCQAQPQL